MRDIIYKFESSFFIYMMPLDQFQMMHVAFCAMAQMFMMHPEEMYNIVNNSSLGQGFREHPNALEPFYEILNGG